MRKPMPFPPIVDWNNNGIIDYNDIAIGLAIAEEETKKQEEDDGDDD